MQNQQEQNEELRIRINDDKILEQFYKVVSQQEQKNKQQQLKLLLLDMNTLRMNRMNIKRLTKILSKSEYLKELILFLRYNSINISELEKLGQSIQNITNLEHLKIDLQGNRFQSYGLKIFGLQIEQNINLQYLILNLRGNQIESEGMIPFCKNLQNLKNLHGLNLNLAFNKLCNDGALAIVDLVQNNSQIHSLELDFENNQIEKTIFYNQFSKFDHFFSKFQINFGQPMMILNSNDKEYRQRDLQYKMEEIVNYHYKVSMPYTIMKLFLLEECILYDDYPSFLPSSCSNNMIGNNYQSQTSIQQQNFVNKKKINAGMLYLDLLQDD